MTDSELIAKQAAIIHALDYDIKQLHQGKLELMTQNSELTITLMHTERELKREIIKRIYVDSYIDKLKKRPKFIYIINKKKKK